MKRTPALALAVAATVLVLFGHAHVGYTTSTEEYESSHMNGAKRRDPLPALNRRIQVGVEGAGPSEAALGAELERTLSDSSEFDSVVVGGEDRNAWPLLRVRLGKCWTVWTPLGAWTRWKVAYGYSAQNRRAPFGGDISIEAEEDARDDVFPVYASGSVEARRTFFGFSTLPDLREESARPIARAVVAELARAQRTARGVNTP